MPAFAAAQLDGFVRGDFQPDECVARRAGKCRGAASEIERFQGFIKLARFVLL